MYYFSYKVKQFEGAPVHYEMIIFSYFVQIWPFLFLGNNTEAQEFLSRGGQVIIRMRGLPYDCTAKQVVRFFYWPTNSKTKFSLAQRKGGI